MARQGKKNLTIFQKIDKFGDLFFLNILFIVSCIPIITIGAATTALYSFTIKMVDDEEGSSVLKSYCKAFKENFKQATKAWLVVLCALGVIYIEFVLSYSLTGYALAFEMAIMAIEAIFLTFILPLLFPLIARYENTTRNMFKNSIIIAITNLPTWLSLFFIWALPIALYATSREILYYTWVLWLVILVAVIAYGSSMILVKLFDKLENKEEPEEEEASEDEETEGNEEI